MSTNEISNKKKRSFFGVKERGSTIGREILAGAVVFLAMIYILPVNSSILGGMGAIDGVGMNAQGVFAATAIASAVATMIMALIAKYPVALSAGMGMNAFIAYTICGSLGYNWIEAMALVLIAGVLFFIMTLTPIRKMIIEAMPADLKLIISAGLGCFICFVGLKGSGLIAADPGTLVALGSFADPSVLLALFGVILVFVCMMIPNKRVQQMAIVIAMASTAVLGVILGFCGVNGMPAFVDMTKADSWIGPLNGLKDVFGKCFNGEAMLSVLKQPTSYALIFSLIFVNLFDTTATLVAIGKDTGIMNEKGEMVGGKKAMLADAAGAVICAPLGTSTVTSFAESTIGVEFGARTGLSALTTSILFLCSLFLYPLFSVFTSSSVTCMALVAVGALMFTNNLKQINWNDKIVAFTTFLTLIFMLLTYSLSNGLGLGLILYIVMMLVAKRGKEIKPILYVIGAFFLISFAVNAVIPLLGSSDELEEFNIIFQYLSQKPSI